MAQKFKIGQAVKLSEKALKRTRNNLLCLDGCCRPELDPIAKFATGVVTEYDGGYDVEWDNSNGVYVSGLYNSWWDTKDLSACTKEERRKLSNQYMIEMRIRHEQEVEQKRMEMLEVHRDKELKNGFEDKEYITEACWLYDHDNTDGNLYVNAYYFLNEDLPGDLKMKNGLYIDFPIDLHILHKVRIRARSLKMAYGGRGFRKGFDVQCIFETDKKSAAANTKRIYRGDKGGMSFILPDKDGGYHFAYMKYSGHAQWTSTVVMMFFLSQYPDILIKEPEGGFDSLLAL